VEIKDKLLALKNDFDLWRSKREKGTPVPSELKEKACSLLNDHDIYHIARSCSVSRNLIETWNKNLKKTPAKKKALHFVEMESSLTSQKETPTNNLNIELTKKNGEKMSVSGDIPHESLNLILRSFFETDHMKVMI
tara:strand:- start:236 stop:643 length:408 start_codon:yes stop_codon:yes gene_type:complete